MAMYFPNIVLKLMLVQLISGKIVYEWTDVAFTDYPKHQKWRPTSFEYLDNRMYITFVDVLKTSPGSGVIAWFSLDEGGENPPLSIYGSKEDYRLYDEKGSIMSPMLIRADPCGDLWVMDANVYNISGDQMKDAPIFHIYNTETSKKSKTRHFQDYEWNNNSLFTNLVFETEKSNTDEDGKPCPGVIAYVADFNAFNLLSYHYHQDTAFKFSHPAFKPDPHVEIPHEYVFNMGHQKLNGIYGLAAVETKKYGSLLFFHPLASTKEFIIPAERLRNSSVLTVDIVRMSYDKGPLSEAGKTAYDNATETFFFAEIKTRKIGCLNLRTVLFKNLTKPTYGRYNINLNKEFIMDLKVVGGDLWILTYDEPKITFHKESIHEIIKQAGCTFELQLPDSLGSNSIALRSNNITNNNTKDIIPLEVPDIDIVTFWCVLFMYFFFICGVIL